MASSDAYRYFRGGRRQGMVEEMLQMLANDKTFIDSLRKKKDPDAIDVEFRVVSDEPKLLGDGKE